MINWRGVWFYTKQWFFRKFYSRAQARDLERAVLPRLKKELAGLPERWRHPDLTFIESRPRFGVVGYVLVRYEGVQGDYKGEVDDLIEAIHRAVTYGTRMRLRINGDMRYPREPEV